MSDTLVQNLEGLSPSFVQPFREETDALIKANGVPYGGSGHRGYGKDVRVRLGGLPRVTHVMSSLE